MRDVADRNPASAEAQLLAAEIAYRARRFEEAVRYFDRGGEPPAGRPDLLFYRAVALYESGRRADAAEVLERALPSLRRTPFVEEIEETSAVRRLAPTLRRTRAFKKESGMSWLQLARDGREMRRAQGRTLAQMTLAANTPTLLKAGLVEGDTSAGVLASGQVVGVIEDLPTCEELIDRIVTVAVDELQRSSGYVV